MPRVVIPQLEEVRNVNVYTYESIKALLRAVNIVGDQLGVDFQRGSGSTVPLVGLRPAAFLVTGADGVFNLQVTPNPESVGAVFYFAEAADDVNYTVNAETFFMGTARTMRIPYPGAVKHWRVRAGTLGGQLSPPRDNASNPVSAGIPAGVDPLDLIAIIDEMFHSPSEFGSAFPTPNGWRAVGTASPIGVHSLYPFPTSGVVRDGVSGTAANTTKSWWWGSSGGSSDTRKLNIREWKGWEVVYRISLHPAQSITSLSLSRSNNVVTVNTVNAHGLEVGDRIRIFTAGDNSFIGDFTIATVPSSSSFTFNQSGPAASTTGGYRSYDNLEFYIGLPQMNNTSVLTQSYAVWVQFAPRSATSGNRMKPHLVLRKANSNVLNMAFPVSLPLEPEINGNFGEKHYPFLTISISAPVGQTKIIVKLNNTHILSFEQADLFDAFVVPVFGVRQLNAVGAHIVTYSFGVSAPYTGNEQLFNTMSRSFDIDYFSLQVPSGSAARGITNPPQILHPKS